MQRSLVLPLLILAVPLIADAQVRLFPDEVERVDVIAIERDGRDLYSFDALTGRRSRIRLEVDEEVYFDRSRGRIGMLLTDRRALAVAPGIGWQELRYQLQERAPDTALVENQVALVVTDRRALGFTDRGSWIEERITAHESVEAIRVGSAAGVVATNHRALGLAPERRRFVVTDLQVKEKLESISAQGTLVTLRTSRRILVFSAPRASWTEQKRSLN
jgi:hypothetical protein